SYHSDMSKAVLLAFALSNTLFSTVVAILTSSFLEITRIPRGKSRNHEKNSGVQEECTPGAITNQESAAANARGLREGPPTWQPLRIRRALLPALLLSAP